MLLCLLLLVSGLGKWDQGRIWRACVTRNVAHKVCPGKNGHGFGSIRDCRTKLDTQSFSTERDHKGNCAVSQKSTASRRYFTKLKVKVITAIRAWTHTQEKKSGSFGPDLLRLVLPNLDAPKVYTARKLPAGSAPDYLDTTCNCSQSSLSGTTLL